MSDRLILYPSLVEPLEPSLTQAPPIGWDACQSRPPFLPRPRPLTIATISAPVFVPDVVPIQLDQWYSPFVRPTQPLRSVPRDLSVAPLLVVAPETITLDKWYSPPYPPPRSAPRTMRPSTVGVSEPSLFTTPVIGWDPGQVRPPRSAPKGRPSETVAPIAPVAPPPPAPFIPSANPRPVALFTKHSALNLSLFSSLVEPIAPVPVTRVGRNKPLIRRTPEPLLPGDSEERPDPEARRSGRNWEIMVRILNSLLRTGAVYREKDANNIDVWRISATGLIDDAGDAVGPTGTFTDTFGP